MGVDRFHGMRQWVVGIFGIVVAAVACAGKTPAPAPTPHPVIDPGPPPIQARGVACEVAENTLGGVVGDRIAIACPAGCRAAQLWGTDVYTNDSSMCTAAIHAGVIDASTGGAAMITILAGQPSYAASTQHDVSSQAWGQWNGSFRVDPIQGRFVIADKMRPRTVPPQPSNLLTCASTASAELPGAIGTRKTLICPAGCMTGQVWGSGIYTDDSAMCVAAVHAGVTSIMGGSIVVTILGGLPAYPATQQNGVTTGAWGAWGRSYRVDRP
jgi:hypothetical protein